MLRGVFRTLRPFSTFEETVNGLTDQVAADFIGLTLTAADTLIRKAGSVKPVILCREAEPEP